MGSALTQPIKWHGGKHYLAKRIIALMPRHLNYVETHFGGGNVLLQKNPDGVSEIVNDISLDLTNFWTVLQRPDLFGKFRRQIECVPMSESRFEQSMEVGDRLIKIWGNEHGGSIARAVAFFIRARQSRQGLMKSFATLTRNRTRRGMNEQVSSWLTAIEGLADIHERLKRVLILNRDALEVILELDAPHTLFYCDPPYLHETRKTTNDYQHEMTIDQHRDLLEVLSAIQGKFILSGYPSKLYDAFAAFHGWHCEQIPIDNKASGAATKEIKIECLWMNFQPEEANV